MTEGSVMTAIVFFKTTRLDDLRAFYIEDVGCELWMDQGDCAILRFGTFLFGFCQRDDAETEGILTFVLPDRSAVDAAYARHSDRALDPPCDNLRYPIYNFFARDPDGRLVEFQVFTNQPDFGSLCHGSLGDG